MAEWSNAAVLKTVEGHTSGGSNPSFSAFKFPNVFIIIYKFVFLYGAFLDPYLFDFCRVRYVYIRNIINIKSNLKHFILLLSPYAKIN